MRFYSLFITFVLLCAGGFIARQTLAQDAPAAAGHIISVEPGDSVLDLSGELELFKDSTQQLTFQEVSSAAYRDKFQKSDFNPPIVPVTQDVVWGRLVLNNNDPNVMRYFYIQFFLLEKVDFFVPDAKGDIVHTRAGRSVPYVDHVFPDRNVTVPVQLPAGEVAIYIRIIHPVDNYYIPVFLADAYGLVKLESGDIARISFYFACSLILFIINMIVFFVIREKVYLFYSLFILLNGFLLVGLDGFPFVWFDRAMIASGEWSLELAAHIASIFSILFFINFLQIESRSPLLAKSFYVLSVLFAINGVLSVFDIPVAEPLYFVFVMTGSIVQLVISIRYFLRDVYARYYSVAWGIHLTIVILYAFAALNIVETHIRFPEIMMGNTVELCILAFALGQRFIFIINEKRQMEQKVNEVMQRENSLKRLTHLDPLTEVYNRRKFDESLNAFFSRDNRDYAGCSLIILDIDKFKHINDQYGHDIGDHVLIYLTKTVRKLIRKTDVFCRFGGEEFVILLEGAGYEEAVRLAETIRRSVADERFIDQEKIITVSCGVTSCQKDDTLKSFMKRADEALYHAKNKGRNRVESIL